MSLSFPPAVEALRISARDNPLLQRIRKLLADPGATARPVRSGWRATTW